MKFLAAILEQHNQPMVIRELETRDPLYVGQVLVKIAYSGICGAQWNEITGVKGQDKYLPHCGGHEGGGKVVAIGPGVKSLKLGDHVVVHWRKGAGIEATYPKYWCEELGKEIGGGANTTLQKYSVISENRLTKIPKDIPLDIAALMGCAVTTGLGVVFNDLQVLPGHTVAVFGCGGVGLCVIKGARLVNASEIAGIDINNTKLGQASVMGATYLINSHINPERLTERRTGSFDFVVDTTGNPDVMKLAWEITAPTGTLCLVAQLRHDKSMALQTLGMQTGKRIIGSDGGSTNPTLDIPRYIKLYKHGLLGLESLITHRYKLEDINTALNELRLGHVGRAVIDMSHD